MDHTFLFTDIEGSTTLWERFSERMRDALARHDSILRSVIERHNGHVFKTVGDSLRDYESARSLCEESFEIARGLASERHIRAAKKAFDRLMQVAV